MKPKVDENGDGTSDFFCIILKTIKSLKNTQNVLNVLCNLEKMLQMFLCKLEKQWCGVGGNYRLGCDYGKARKAGVCHFRSPPTAGQNCHPHLGHQCRHPYQLGTRPWVNDRLQKRP